MTVPQEQVAEAADKIRCDACPVMCYIRPGARGACDRYGNEGGLLVRVDPHLILEHALEDGSPSSPSGPARSTGTAASCASPAPS